MPIKFLSVVVTLLCLSSALFFFFAGEHSEWRELLGSPFLGFRAFHQEAATCSFRFFFSLSPFCFGGERCSFLCRASGGAFCITIKGCSLWCDDEDESAASWMLLVKSSEVVGLLCREANERWLV